ncbi:hypothetical protein, partial [Escherichia sp. Lx600-2]
TLRAWPISITGQKPTEGPFSALGYLNYFFSWYKPP